MKELFKNLKFAWKYVKGQKSKVIFVAIIGLIMAILGVIVPILSAQLIVNLTSNKLAQLLSIAIIIFLVEIFRNIIRCINDYLLNIIYRETFNNIQVSLGREMLRLKNKTLDSNSSGFFIQRLMGDTRNLSNIFNVINVNLADIICNIGVLVAVFNYKFLVFPLYVFNSCCIIYFNQIAIYCIL